MRGTKQLSQLILNRSSSLKPAIHKSHVEDTGFQTLSVTTHPVNPVYLPPVWDRGRAELLSWSLPSLPVSPSLGRCWRNRSSSDCVCFKLAAVRWTQHLHLSALLDWESEDGSLRIHSPDHDRKHLTALDASSDW